MEVTVDGEGAGTVEGEDIVCSEGPCVVRLSEGDEVTLEAQEGPESVFDGFSSADCTGTEPCHLTMNEDKAVTAIFALDEKESPNGDGGEETEVPSAPPETIE